MGMVLCLSSLKSFHPLYICRIRGLSKKYPTLNFPAHSSDARPAPLCPVERDSILSMLEFFLDVPVSQSLPTGRRVNCSYKCLSDFDFS